MQKYLFNTNSHEIAHTISLRSTLIHLHIVIYLYIIRKYKKIGLKNYDISIDTDRDLLWTHLLTCLVN